MKSVSELLPGVMQVKYLICKRCGNEVEFLHKQWRKTCGRCGMVLTLPKPIIVDMQRDKLSPACFICNDRGLVFYQAQEGGNVYDYVAKCICRAGQERKEDYPTIDKADNICDLNFLEQSKRKEWEELTGRKADIALFARAEELPVNVEEIPF